MPVKERIALLPTLPLLLILTGFPRQERMQALPLQPDAASLIFDVKQQVVEQHVDQHHDQADHANTDQGRDNATS